MALHSDFNLSLKGSFAEAASLQNPDHRHQKCSVPLKTFGLGWLAFTTNSTSSILCQPRPPFLFITLLET